MNHKTSIWAFAITSVAAFMVTLDNLVVTTAIPVIRRDLDAGIGGLEWTVNAYTLTFAVLLLTGAALGDRFGRRKLLAIGLAIFTVSSAAAAWRRRSALSTRARALQGLGGAIVMPLTLTILAAAVPAERRGLALGAWGGISGLAVAFGPLVGGAVVDGFSWHWVFWLNVPIGIVLVPLVLLRLEESRGPWGRVDLPGLALVSSGLLGIVWALVRGNTIGWTSPEIVGAGLAGVVLVVAFVALGAARAGADAADALLPQPDIRVREHGVALLLVRHVRVDLPARPVLPDRPALLAAVVGAAHPALDGDADDRRAHRRRVLGPDRRPAPDGRGPRAPGARARVDRRRVDADDALHRARRALHDRGCRHGALLRAGRERRALVGAAGRAGAGVGRQQRDPGARRRARRGRARLDLRRLGRLRVGTGVHRRDGAGRLRSAPRSSWSAPWRRSRSAARPRGTEQAAAEPSLELAA